MPQVHIPPSLRRFTEGQKQIEVEGSNVRQTIDEVDRRFPGFRDRIVVGNSLKPGIAVAVGSRIGDLGLLEPVESADELHFVLPVSGG